MKKISFGKGKKYSGCIRSGLLVALVSAALCGCSSGTSVGAGKSTALSATPRNCSASNQGVYYSIFVRSFADSNGDGIGDFNGITAKLDYLNDGKDETTSDLGVTGIWLLPIYPSHSYHGYDVDDYYAVNPEYGTMEDFENLVAECRKRGINVILDMTVNHSSTYNAWFQKSRNPENAEHDWYRWIKKDTPGFYIGQKQWNHALWNEDSRYKGNYYCGLFGSHMPDFNLDNEELRAEFKKVMKFWLDKGVTGFRYDAAGHVYNSVKTASGTDSAAKAVEFFSEIISYNKSVCPETYSVGEVWENSAVRATYAKGLGSDFHFDMGDKIIDIVKYGKDGNNAFAYGIQSEMDRLRDQAPGYTDAPFLINHDTPRQGSRVKDVAGAKACASIYLLMEGIPFMYYGEEIGMRSGSEDETKRTPMLWDSKDEMSGKPKDSMQTTWEEDIYNKKTVPVSVQESDADSLLNYYKRLIRLRLAHSALYEGRFAVEPIENKSLTCWRMESDSEEALVIVNVTNEIQEVDLGEKYGSYSVGFKTSAAVTDVVVQSKMKLCIPPKETVVIFSDK